MNRFQRIHSLKRLLAIRATPKKELFEAAATSEIEEGVSEKDSRSPFRPKRQLMELEGRLLFDAAIGASGLELGSDALGDLGIDEGSDDGDIIDPAVSAILSDALDFTSAPYSKTIIFVDAAVSDLSGFIDVDDPSLEFFLLDSNEDGIGQIADALAGRTDVEAVHIISHGQSGALALGNTMVNRGDLSGYNAELAIIGDALSEGGDLLIYGCNVAEGKAGQKFIEALSKMTGADVAASSDWTGDISQGGDWELEVSVGQIDVSAIFGTDGDVGYANLLAAPTNTAPASVTVVEDVAYSFTLPSLGPTVSVFDADNDILIVELSVTNGTLDLTATANVTAAGVGTKIVVLSGLYSDVNLTLATLAYTTDQDFTGMDTMVISSADPTATTISNTQINVSPVNDAPEITVPAAQNIAEDTQTLIAGIAIADVDDNSGLLTVDLSVANGSLDLNTSGIVVTYRSASSDALTLSGTKAAINTALASLTYKPNQDYVGADALAITINDNGNSGAGGALADIDSVALNVTPVNDIPVLTSPLGGYDVLGETTTALTGLSINDVDAGGLLTLKMNISVANGSLSYTGSLVPASGNPAGDTSLIFIGTQAALNSVLTQLNYTGNAGFIGTDQMLIQVDDDGNTGAGGAQISSDNVGIEVHSKDEGDFNISDTDPTGLTFNLLDKLASTDGLNNISFPPPKLTVASAIGEFRVVNDLEPMRAVVEGREDDFTKSLNPDGEEPPIRTGLSLDQEDRDFKANVFAPSGLGENLDGDQDLTPDAETAAENKDQNEKQSSSDDEETKNETDGTPISDAVELSADQFDRNVDQLLDDLGAPSPSRDE